jgi:hypothetical protein
VCEQCSERAELTAQAPQRVLLPSEEEESEDSFEAMVRYKQDHRE